MAEDREQLNKSAEASSYSLESILAEYKGNAYIAGEKKLSREELERQAEHILREMTGGLQLEEQEEVREYVPGKNRAQPRPEEPAPETHGAEKVPPAQPEAETPEEQSAPEQAEEKPERAEPEPPRDGPGPSPEIPPRPRKREKIVPIQQVPEEERPREKRGDARARRQLEKERAREAKREQAQRERERLLEERERLRQRRDELLNELRTSYHGMSDDEQEFFGVGKYARESSVIDQEKEVDAVIEREAARRNRQAEQRSRRAARRADETADGERAAPGERREMTPAEAARIYASGIGWLRRRTRVAFFFVLILSYLTLAEGFSLPVPAALISPTLLPILSLTLLLLVLLCGVDVFLTGIGDALGGHVSGVTLSSVAVIAALADGVGVLVSHERTMGMPFCAVAAVSLLCSMWGTRLSRSAYRTTIKTMSTARVPTIVTAEWEKVDEGVVLTKKSGSAQGFISKSLERDLAEQWYARFAPLFLVAIVLFSLIASVFRGEGKTFLHCLAAMSCAAASFSSMLAFNLPFCRISRRLSTSGAALAGWSGACDIYDAIGIVVKDRDLFPENVLTLNGLKMLSTYTMERVVAYASSMIIASGSCLTRVFGDLLKEYSSSQYGVKEFYCDEGGGISANIYGDKVLVGSSGYMNLMGIRVPANLDINTAVYIAINEQLAGMFIINYEATEMVQNALVTLLHSRLRPLFAIRDFNITPLMIMQKFKVSMAELKFLPIEARYKLSGDSNDARIKPSAIMSRDGLSHFVEVARSGKRLVRAVRLGTVLSLLGAIVGLVLMFFLCFRGAFASASAANLLLFMLLWLLPILFLGLGENEN